MIKANEKKNKYRTDQPNGLRIHRRFNESVVLWVRGQWVKVTVQHSKYGDVSLKFQSRKPILCVRGEQYQSLGTQHRSEMTALNGLPQISTRDSEMIGLCDAQGMAPPRAIRRKLKAVSLLVKRSGRRIV